MRERGASLYVLFEDRDTTTALRNAAKCTADKQTCIILPYFMSSIVLAKHSLLTKLRGDTGIRIHGGPELHISPYAYLPYYTMIYDMFS